MAKSNLIVKSFEYKIRANRAFEAAAQKALDDSRFVYNCALEQRIMWYRSHGASIGLYEQSRQLTEARRDLPEVGDCIRAIQQDAIEKLDLAFQAFFARQGRGGKPGFPRFKSAERYRTFTQKFDAGRSCPLQGDTVYIPSVGRIRVRLSRPIEGKVKQVQVTHRSDGWYVTLVCDIQRPDPLPDTGEYAGIDVGIRRFATLSNGDVIKNPRFLKSEIIQVKRRSRSISKKKLGSANRLKARRKISLTLLKLARQRRDFFSKTAFDLVKRFDLIVVEDLDVQSLIDGLIYKRPISDVGWGTFFRTLERKAENAGRIFVRIDPTNTSTTCSRCGGWQDMPLGMHVFRCVACDYIIDRDHNAAINILRLGKPKVTPAEFLCRETKKQGRGGSPDANVVTGI